MSICGAAVTSIVEGYSRSMLLFAFARASLTTRPVKVYCQSFDTAIVGHKMKTTSVCHHSSDGKFSKIGLMPYKTQALYWTPCIYIINL